EGPSQRDPRSRKDDQALAQAFDAGRNIPALLGVPEVFEEEVAAGHAHEVEEPELVEQRRDPHMLAATAELAANGRADDLVNMAGALPLLVGEHVAHGLQVALSSRGLGEQGRTAEICAERGELGDAAK